MKPGLRALTLYAPQAWGVSALLKSVENRRWRTNHRGPLAIHAGAKVPKMDKGWQDVILPNGERCGDAYAFGAIVAVVDVLDCVGLDDLPTAYHEAGDPAFDPCGPWCFILGNVRRLARPVPCSGKQNLWRVPDTVVTEIDRQLANGAAVLVTK